MRITRQSANVIKSAATVLFPTPFRTKNTLMNSIKRAPANGVSSQPGTCLTLDRCSVHRHQVTVTSGHVHRCTSRCTDAVHRNQLHRVSHNVRWNHDTTCPRCTARRQAKEPTARFAGQGVVQQNRRRVRTQHGCAAALTALA